MSSRIRIFLTGFLTLLIAALLALAPVAAKPASGEYQLFDEVAAGHQAFISLAALENFDYHAKIASECCDAGHVAGVGLAEADKTFDGYETLTTGKPSDGLWRPVLRSQTNLSDETIEKIVFGLEATGAVLELGAGGVATIRHAGKVTKVDDLRKLDDAVEEIAETRGVLVGGSYVPRGNAIVRNSTVQLNSNIVTKTGETIPAGSVITENGGAIKIVTPDGVAITGKTDNLLRSQQLALPSPATKRGMGGIWDQGRLTPIQRGNAIEDHLAETDYGGWTRVGSQNNGFSPAWDFNQGSTWVSLKTVDTSGSGWQTTMRSHIRELETWSSPTNPNAVKVLDIRVQPGGAFSAQSLIDYGASRGVQVRVNEF